MSFSRLFSIYSSTTSSFSLTSRIFHYIAVLYILVYSISTIVYIRHLHNVPDTTPCNAVLPRVREFLRIGGWILLVYGILFALYYGYKIVKIFPLLVKYLNSDWIIRILIVRILITVVSIAFNVAVPIISIQYANTLREASSVSPNNTSVKRCLQLAPYRRETIDAVAWVNIICVVIVLGLFGGSLLMGT